MSEILSAEEVATILAYATGPNGCDDCQEQTVALCGSHEALRARVRDLEAALRYVKVFLPSWQSSAHDEIDAALGAVPQPAACPGSGQPLVDPGAVFGTCPQCGHTFVVHDEGSDIAWRHAPQTAKPCPTCRIPWRGPSDWTGFTCPDPWHREAHSE